MMTNSSDSNKHLSMALVPLNINHLNHKNIFPLKSRQHIKKKSRALFIKKVKEFIQDKNTDSKMLIPALMTLSSPCVLIPSNETIAAERKPSATSNYFRPYDWCMSFNVPWEIIEKKNN
ncbi:uncharacterized protein LOC136091166 [Hydra vulgaris]|uniref:Uncharacterized protein LOC136091166 n=1 Tax=Hydra vulgaris TaxID=6087 RepID=A0ABM4DI92_HYDVU